MGHPHSSFTFSNFKSTIVMLDPAFVRQTVGDAVNTEGLELTPLQSNRDKALARLLIAAEVDIELGLPGGRLWLETFGAALAAHLLTQHSSKRVVPKEYGGKMPKHLLRRAIDFIHENLGRNISLAEISAELDMSPYHFCRSFKRETG